MCTHLFDINRTKTWSALIAFMIQLNHWSFTRFFHQPFHRDRSMYRKIWMKTLREKKFIWMEENKWNSVENGVLKMWCFKCVKDFASSFNFAFNSMSKNRSFARTVDHLFSKWNYYWPENVGEYLKTNIS